MTKDGKTLELTPADTVWECFPPAGQLLRVAVVVESGAPAEVYARVCRVCRAVVLAGDIDAHAAYHRDSPRHVEPKPDVARAL